MEQQNILLIQLTRALGPSHKVYLLWTVEIFCKMSTSNDTKIRDWGEFSPDYTAVTPGFKNTASTNVLIGQSFNNVPSKNWLFSLMVVLQQTFLHQTHNRRCAFLHQIANKILRKTFQMSLLFDCLRSVSTPFISGIRLSMVNLQGRGSRGHHDTSEGQRTSGTYCMS